MSNLDYQRSICVATPEEVSYPESRATDSAQDQLGNQFLCSMDPRLSALQNGARYGNAAAAEQLQRLNQTPRPGRGPAAPPGEAHRRSGPFRPPAALPDLSRPPSCRASRHHVDDPASIEIVADEDSTTSLAAFFRVGEVDGTGSVAETLDGAVAAADGHPIENLSVLGHASPGSQHVSSDGRALALRAPGAGGGFPPDVEDALARVRGHLTPDAEMLLGGCNVGAATHRDGSRAEGVDLAATLASRVQRPVRAAASPGDDGLQRPMIPGQEGPQMVCAPTDDPNLVRCASEAAGDFECAPGENDTTFHCAPAQARPWMGVDMESEANVQALQAYMSRM